MRIVNRKPDDRTADARLYHSNKIQKITDYIKLLNCTFVKNILARDCLSNFRVAFRLPKKHASASHNPKNTVFME